jgi:alpha-D-ribose 1-methylphosphonate 5-triphosphate diphosphatase
MSETILTNAVIVAAEEEFAGTLVLRDGLIAAIDRDPASAAPGAIDCEQDYLLPGLVELHTDNLEKHFSPRPGVRWPSRAAVVAHDAQVAAAGITTVFDALALGDVFEGSQRVKGLAEMCEGIDGARRTGMLKSEHLLHLRCELSYGQVLELYEALMDDPAVRLVSIMDHTPGQRQFVDVEKYRFYYMKKYDLSDAEFEDFLAARRADQAKYATPNRREILARAHRLGHILASHDDATIDHVAASCADGMSIAEFPTTLEAARASHESGLAVLMGGPNLVLGFSHSGNIAARDLAARGLLDIVSSDYVPSCLIAAPFILADAGLGIDLPHAVHLVARNPARAAGLTDRGEISAGRRADLVRVRRVEGMPVIRSVWRQGQRIV